MGPWQHIATDLVKTDSWQLASATAATPGQREWGWRSTMMGGGFHLGHIDQWKDINISSRTPAPRLLDLSLLG